MAKALFLFFTICLFSNTLAFCPSKCVCDDANLQAICTEANFDTLPILLNPSLRELRLRGNHIRQLPVLSSIYSQLELLELDQNRIEHIDANVFAGLTSLRVLKLSNNRISQIHQHAFSGLRSLEHLDLSGNGLYNLLTSPFSELRSLRILDLSSNSLSNVSELVFHGLNALTQLNLADNQLSFLNSSLSNALHPLRLRSLVSLDLSRNPLHVLTNEQNPFAGGPLPAPTQPPKTLRQVAPHRLNPFLRRHSSNVMFNNMPTPAALTGDESRWTSLRQLNLQQCALHRIESEALAGLRSLETLSLSHNLLPEVPSKVLSKLTSLRRLELNGNQFGQLTDNAFVGLQSLRWLDLGMSAVLSHVSELAFTGLMSLEHLSLSSCPQLSTLPGALFQPLPNLQRVHLRGNQLTTFPEQFVVDFARMRELDISENPLQCDCSLLWLRDFLRTRTAGNAIVCASPSPLVAKPLSSLADEQLQCDLLSPAILALFTLIACVLCVAIVLFLFYALYAMLPSAQLDSSATKLPRPASRLSRLFRRNGGLYESSLAAGSLAKSAKPAYWTGTNASMYPYPLVGAHHTVYPAPLNASTLRSSNPDSTIISGLSNTYEVVSLGSGLSTYGGSHNYESLYETCANSSTTNTMNIGMMRHAPLDLPPFTGYLQTWNPSFDEQAQPMIHNGNTMVTMRD